MEDYGDDYEYGDEPEFVMGYNEGQARGMGGAGVMGTVLEGTGALARAQERMLQRSEGFALDKKLLTFFSQVKDLYKRFGVDDQQLMFDKFHSLKNYAYKNPYAFLLAYIALGEDKKTLSKRTLQSMMRIARELETPSLSEADIIRYYRLLKQTS